MAEKDRLRWGENRLEEHHQWVGKMYRNIRERVRLLARLKQQRAGSDAFTDAEVRQVEAVFDFWKDKLSRIMPENLEQDLPEPTDIPDARELS